MLVRVAAINPPPETICSSVPITFIAARAAWRALIIASTLLTNRESLTRMPVSATPRIPITIVATSSSVSVKPPVFRFI